MLFKHILLISAGNPMFLKSFHVISLQLLVIKEKLESLNLCANTKRKSFNKFFNPFALLSYFIVFYTTFMSRSHELRLAISSYIRSVTEQ